MSISTKTRKILWGRSGNRCSICRRELTLSKSAYDPTSVVGDECHIISKRDGGPRSYQNNSSNLNLDSYDNLLLLCKTHHKLIDDQPIEYDVQTLTTIKAGHERWVRESLAKTDRDAFQDVTLLPRITAGKDLVNIVKGADAYRFDHDDLETPDEAAMLSNFLQQLQDNGDILIDLDVGASVSAGFQLKQELDELEAMGFRVFGERRLEKMKIGDLEVATVLVLRENNPNILDLTTKEEG